MYNLPANQTIFFSEKGITPASAGHIANLAKEYYRRQERQLQGLTLTNQSIRLLSGESAQIAFATSDEDFAKIPELIDNIAKAKALIAWLREAIKAREALTALVQTEEYKSAIPVDDIEGCQKPTLPEGVDDDDDEDIDDNEWGAGWWDDREHRETASFLSEDERIRYRFALQVERMLLEYAGVRGRFVQKVNEAEIIKRHPLSWTVNDTPVYRSVCVTKDLIAEVRYNLDKLIQKHEYKGPAEDIAREAKERLAQERQEYLSAVNKYNSYLRAVRHAQEIRSREILSKIRNLRILIPDSLQGVYEQISALGH